MYIYETIDYLENYPANVFIASIEYSNFHWHLDYELILVLKGSVMLTDGVRTSVLKAGDLYLVNTKSIHSLDNRGERNLCLFIQINNELLKNPKDPTQTYFFYLNSQDDILIPKCGYGKIRQAAAQIGYGWRMEKATGVYRMYALLYGIIADLFESSVYDTYLSSDRNSNEDNRFLVEILNYIQDNYKNSHVLEEVCQKKGIGEKNLYRLLKEKIGQTPNKFLLENRIEHAKYLLTCTKKSISYIAGDSGFSSESTFFRVFKQTTGTSPLQYRREGILSNYKPELKNYLDFNYAEARSLLVKLIEKE